MATRLRPLNAPQTCALCKPAEYLRWDVAANCPKYPAYRHSRYYYHGAVAQAAEPVKNRRRR